MILIPLELREALIKGYRGYNNKKYYIHKKKTIAGKTVWVFKRNN